MDLIKCVICLNLTLMLAMMVVEDQDVADGYVTLAVTLSTK